MTTPRRLVLVFGFGLPLALASLLSLAQCDSDGITPICPNDGADCVTPPGTSSASVIITTGTGGSTGGSTNTGGSGTSSAGGSADGGITSILDASILDALLGQ